jgi:hypothetical protein
MGLTFLITIFSVAMQRSIELQRLDAETRAQLSQSLDLGKKAYEVGEYGMWCFVCVSPAVDSVCMQQRVHCGPLVHTIKSLNHNGSNQIKSNHNRLHILERIANT